MSLLLAVDARTLRWNEAGELRVVYRGPYFHKLYRLRISDQGIAPALLAAPAPETVDAHALERLALGHAGATVEVRQGGHVRLHIGAVP